MSFPPIIPPTVPNLEIEKTDEGPLGPSKVPPEPLFETDDSVLPDDDRPADGSDKPTGEKPRR
ncbi:MAG: hypothetical protein JWQ89_1099 [Devosia sp.]|uniref:hypothetical protein n=1 Tax=Devosia sp. TaxID=1871048 RepID=UPI002635DAEF|nr:hypothetical protein [Devosia sp.]MDB5539372.1 hypothetical protein [Devosia sp.]